MCHFFSVLSMQTTSFCMLHRFVLCYKTMNYSMPYNVDILNYYVLYLNHFIIISAKVFICTTNLSLDKY